MLKQLLAALALFCVVAAPAVAQNPNADGNGNDADKDKLSGFGVGVAVNYTFDDEIDSAFLDSNGVVRTNEKTRGDVAFILEGHFLYQDCVGANRQAKPAAQGAQAGQAGQAPQANKLTCEEKGGHQSYLPSFLEWLDPLTLGVFNRHCEDTLICGKGPFLAVKTGGSTELIESVGVGYMWGTKHRDPRNNSLGGVSQWNFGLGISIDPHVNRLAQGIKQGEPLPVGQTEIRYEDDVVFGVMMLFSVGIG